MIVRPTTDNDWDNDWDRQDTFEWIWENEEKYKGQWIAVLGSDLIAASPELSEVLEAVKKRRLDLPPLLHFVD